MKITLLVTMLLVSLSSFAEGKEIQRLSADVRAQALQEKGIIVAVTGEAAKYMYLRGLDRNGIFDTYQNQSGSYNVTTVKYGNFTCDQGNFDIFSLIPGETVEYTCRINVHDYEI